MRKMQDVFQAACPLFFNVLLLILCSPSHPVTRVRLPETLDGYVKRQLHAHRAVFVAARQFYIAHSIPLENRWMRMVETVAVAYLKYRNARLHGVEERLGRRRLAAVMRHDQHVSLEPGGVAFTHDCSNWRSTSASMSAAKSAERPAALVTFSTHEVAFGLAASGPACGQSTSNTTPSHCQRCPATQRNKALPRPPPSRPPQRARAAWQRGQELPDPNALEHRGRSA